VLGLAYRTGVAWNESAFANPKFDELLTKAEGIVDVEERKKVIDEIETLMQEDGPITQPLWRDLYDAGADLIVNGHDHTYERFAPQTPTGELDGDRGIVELVVGTGGRSHYPFPIIRDNSLVRNNTTYGVLRLVLSPGRWSFTFVPVAGRTFSDGGGGTCH